jgi:hypothetical protein
VLTSGLARLAHVLPIFPHAAAGDHPEITLELRVQAAAALAAVTVALSAWAQSDGADQLPTLVDRTFHALRRPPVGNNDA